MTATGNAAVHRPSGTTACRRHRHRRQDPRRPDGRRAVGHARRRPPRRGADHALRRVRAFRGLRLRGARLRCRALRRAQGSAPHRPGGSAGGRRRRRRAGRRHRVGELDATTDDLLPPPSPDDLGADPLRCAVVAGSGIGGIRTLEDQVIGYAEKGPSRVGPFLVPMMMPNAAAALVAIRHGFTGPNLAVATACATGAHAIGEGARPPARRHGRRGRVRRHRGLREPRGDGRLRPHGRAEQEPRPVRRAPARSMTTVTAS